MEEARASFQDAALVVGAWETARVMSVGNEREKVSLTKFVKASILR